MLLEHENIPFHQDWQLAQAAAGGDRRAAHKLADRLFGRVRATVLYLAAGHRDADDMMQLSLIQILRSAGGYRGECSLERWADRIVVRTALRELKKSRRKAQVVDLDDAQISPVGAGQEKSAFRRQVQLRLAKLLETLNAERRTAMVLHWVHGYTVPEIAQATDAPYDTVRDRLRKGKRKLKKKIAKDPILKDWARVWNNEQ
jgi:RNA polymerase sigma-70 factor (ECF subfamily)